MVNHCLVSARLACLILLLLLSACASQASMSSQAANDQVVLTRDDSTETSGTWDIQPAVGIYYWQKARGDYVKCTATVFDAQPNQPTTTLRYALAATRCTGREEKTNITQTADAYMVVNLCRGDAGTPVRRTRQTLRTARRECDSPTKWRCWSRRGGCTRTRWWLQNRSKRRA